MNRIFSLLTGNKTLIALIVIILALIASFAVTVIAYKVKVKTLELELQEEQIQGILLKDSLSQANIAIDKQNKAISNLKIDNDKALVELQKKIDNITKEKQELLEQAEKSLIIDSSCENKLKIINNTQLEFLNER